MLTRSGGWLCRRRSKLPNTRCVNDQARAHHGHLIAASLLMPCAWPVVTWADAASPASASPPGAAAQTGPGAPSAPSGGAPAPAGPATPPVTLPAAISAALASNPAARAATQQLAQAQARLAAAQAQRSFQVSLDTTGGGSSADVI